VVMTAPHVGNTGVNDADSESDRIWVSGYVVRDPARMPSSWRARRSLDEELAAYGVVGISGVDTRALTRHLRERGAMRVGVSSVEADPSALLARVLDAPPMEGADLTAEVTTASTQNSDNLSPTAVATAHGTPPVMVSSTNRSLWATFAAVVVLGGVSITGYQLMQSRSEAQESPPAAVQTPPVTAAQRGPEDAVAMPLVVAKPAPKAANEPAKVDPAAAQAETAKFAAAKAAADAAAARAAAARKVAEERRRRAEAERSAQLAEEQRKRDEEARRIALEQAEKDRLAAEQASAARIFTDIATAVIGSRQNKRR